jgi:aspartate aminotransferase
VWNACGLRVGGLITDNQLFHQQAVAENTANLCSNAIGQYIFGALAHEKSEDLTQWYAQQRAYYKDLTLSLTTTLKSLMPELIVSSPAAALYTVVDVRNVVNADFSMKEFVLWCAQQGKVELNGQDFTLLVAPMCGFYSTTEKNPGETQLRIAYVESPEKMQLVPELLVKLLRMYLD